MTYGYGVRVAGCVLRGAGKERYKVKGLRHMVNGIRHMAHGLRYFAASNLLPDLSIR